ncbi:MAG: hypothetical protein AB7H97_21395, partial [Pseudobdellovibrionaceae bacterium]
VRPPSTGMFTPEMYPAAGDAKKAMASAVSQRSPRRRKGIVASHSARISASDLEALLAAPESKDSRHRVSV